MADAGTPPTRLDLGLVLRPFEATSLPLGWVGFAIAVGYLALHGVYDGIVLATFGFPSGEAPAWRREDWWTEFVNAALFGYLPAAYAVMRRGARADLQSLRPRLRVSDVEFARLVESTASPDRRMLRRVGLVGLLTGVALPIVDPTTWGGSVPSLSSPTFVWALCRLPVFSWLVVRLMLAEFTMTRAYTRLGRDAVDVELLDLQALAPFARKGQRSALTWVLFSSIFSLFWLSDTAASLNLWLLMLVLSIVVLAFVLPLVGIHANIRKTKHAELDRLRDAIRAERGAATAPDSGTATPRLANLIAYHQLVEAVREWPIDAGNLLRLFLYLLVGLGSWLGGALVERLLDSAL